MQKVIFIALFAHFISLILAEHPYCFRFTWVGPYQDKENLDELNCQAFHGDLNNVPCREPLMATEHDTIPDTSLIWQNNKFDKNLYGCPMTPGSSCVKYSYIYNKGVQNITYMCAKVNATEGCYRQRYLSGLEVSVCVCKSYLGMVPCNNAPITTGSAKLIMTLILLYIIF